MVKSLLFYCNTLSDDLWIMDNDLFNFTSMQMSMFPFWLLQVFCYLVLKCLCLTFKPCSHIHIFFITHTHTPSIFFYVKKCKLKFIINQSYFWKQFPYHPNILVTVQRALLGHVCTMDFGLWWWWGRPLLLPSSIANCFKQSFKLPRDLPCATICCCLWGVNHIDFCIMTMAVFVDMNRLWLT